MLIGAVLLLLCNLATLAWLWSLPTPDPGLLPGGLPRAVEDRGAPDG